MSILDSAKDAFNKGANSVNRGTRSLQLKNHLSSLERERENLCAQLGASLYDQTRQNSEFTAGREDLYSAIEQNDIQRAGVQNELAQIEQEAQAAKLSYSFPCPVCGATVNSTEQFCKSCGNRVEPPMQQAYQSPAMTFACPNCGGAVAQGDAFCMECGCRIENTQVPPTPQGAAETSPVQDAAAQAQQNAAVPSPADQHRHCTSCGGELAPDDRFCMSCGAKVSPTVDEIKQGISDKTHAAVQALDDKLDAAGDKLDDMADAAAEKIDEAKDKAQPKVEAFAQSASEKIDQAKESLKPKVEAFAQSAGEKIDQVKETVEPKVEAFVQNAGEKIGNVFDKSSVTATDADNPEKTVEAKLVKDEQADIDVEPVEQTKAEKPASDKE